MTHSTRISIALGGLLGIIGSSAAVAQNNTVVLTSAFVSKYANKALITTHFNIHHAHAHPNAVGTSSNDGDLHAAGVPDQEVGLPTVIEIMNAHQDQDGSALLTDGADVTVTGVWRLWFEHPGA